LGADPQTGSAKCAEHGGICSARGDLQYGVKKYAKMSKTAEILRVEKKHLAPPSGQTGNKLGAEEREYCSPSRGVHVLKVW